MLRQGDKPGLSLCDDGLRSFTPPGGTMTHLHGLMHNLEITVPDGQTNVAGALRTLFPLARRKGLLIVMSDLLEDPADLFRALGMYLHRGFTILLFQVMTDDELHLPAVGTARFTDPEGPGRLDVEPDAIRSAYRAELQSFLDSVSQGAKARRIHYALLSTSTPYQEALSQYLSTRGK
jgi:hypothetical protein